MDSTTAASYLRVASLSVAIFDFAQTLPAVWRLYKDQWESGRFTISCALLASIQLTSIMVMTTSNVGWFGRFTYEACIKYWRVPLILKVCQAMASQAIVGIRAFSLSRRSPRIGWMLLLFYVCVSAFQWVTTLYKRQQVVDDMRNCRTVSSSSVMGAWLYYLVAILYDTIATMIALGYLLKYKASTPSCSAIAHLSRMMVYDGLGYLIVLSASNVFNLILYITYQRLQDVQSAGVSVGYAVTWIMSQRLLTRLHEAYLEGRSQNANEVFTISKNLSPARVISPALRRSMFPQKGSGFELTVPDLRDTEAASDPGSVEVRIERTIRLQHDSRLSGQDSYSGMDSDATTMGMP